MGIKKTPSGQVQVEATLTKGGSVQVNGGGYNIQLQSNDEVAIELVKRAKNHASAMITFDFYTTEQTIDDPEDPAQQTFELDEKK